MSTETIAERRARVRLARLLERTIKQEWAVRCRMPCTLALAATLEYLRYIVGCERYDCVARLAARSAIYQIARLRRRSNAGGQPRLARTTKEDRP